MAVEEKVATKRARAIPTWAQAPPDERQYYRDVHGFDPVIALHFPNKTTRYLHYEEWFPLLEDPSLHAAGIEVGARVEIDDKEGVHNRIVFRKGEREATVECTHTVVYAGPIEGMPISAFDDGIAQTRLSKSDRLHLAQTGGHVQLSPWGHFAALKSYVAGIAGAGFANLLVVGNVWSTSDREIPEAMEPAAFIFDTIMQIQILRALRTIAPVSTLSFLADWCINLLETTPAEWFEARQDGPLTDTFTKDLLAHLWKHSSPEWLVTHWRKLEAVFYTSIYMFVRELGEDEWAKIDATLLHVLMYQSKGDAPTAIIENPRVPANIKEELIQDAAQRGGLFYSSVFVKPEDHLALSEFEKRVGHPILYRGTPPRTGSPFFQVKDGRVTHLNLYRQGLKDIPPEISHLTELKELDLAYNELSALPKEIGNLHALELLKLQKNTLNTLPDEIGYLGVLRELVIEDNLLSKLPPALANVDSLKVLRLARNKLDSAPEVIKSIRNLRILDLSNNLFKDLPDWLFEFTNLKELHLAGYCLKELPDAVGHQSTLEKLDISANWLEDLPDALQGLQKLRVLDASYNRLGYNKSVNVMGSLGAIPNLEDLKLSCNNFFPKLPQVQAGFRKLRVLDLSGNNIQELTGAIGALPALERLNLKGNMYLKDLPEALFQGTTLREIEVDKPLARVLRARGWGDRGIIINDMGIGD